MSYQLNQLLLETDFPREARKMRQAMRGQIHFVHKAHWLRVKRKANRRLKYWSRVFDKWQLRANGLSPDFKPRKPRGKRALAFAAYCARKDAEAAARGEVLLEPEAKMSPAE